MKNPPQTPKSEKKDPFQQHISGPSQQYVYDPSQQQYVHDPSQQQQVYEYSQHYLHDSSQPYVHYPSQNNLLDPVHQQPAPAYTPEISQPPSGQGYNNYLGPYPSGPGAFAVTDKPSQGFDGIQQGEGTTQTKKDGAVAAIRRGSRGLFTNPGRWSVKKKLIVFACIVILLVIVIAVPAGVLLNRKRRCKCPSWYDRKSNYYSAYFYPCDSKGKDLNLNKLPSCNWESAGYY